MKTRTRFLALFLGLSLLLGVLGCRSGAAEAAGVQVGSIVTLGSYEQDNNFRDGAEPIEWIVLAAEQDRALLLSLYCLDCIEYNNVSRGWKPWAGSLAREWLNGDFYQAAFSQTEKNSILSTYNVNRSNPQYGTRGGEDTWDKVFLLSLDEAEAYTSRDQRKAQPTAYARALGVQMNKDNGCAWWWLRSPGEAESNAALVWSSGKIEVPGIYFAYAPCGVRPAIWISQSASVVPGYSSTPSNPQPYTDWLADGSYFGYLRSWDSQTMTIELLEFEGLHEASQNYMFRYTGQVYTLDISHATVWLEWFWEQADVQCASIDSALNRRIWGGSTTLGEQCTMQIAFDVYNSSVTRIEFLYAA